MQKKILLIVLGFSLNYLVNCASIPDIPICTEITPIRGWCTKTISDDEFYVDDNNKLNNMTWWEMRPTMVLVPSLSWIEIKTSFIKICKKNGNCSKDIDKWERKFYKVNK